MNTPTAEAAWIAVTLDHLFRDLRALIGENPLAPAGPYCEKCGTLLRDESKLHPCPICPDPRAMRRSESARRAVVKVGADVTFPGVFVWQGVAANA